MLLSIAKPVDSFTGVRSTRETKTTNSDKFDGFVKRLVADECFVRHPGRGGFNGFEDIRRNIFFRSRGRREIVAVVERYIKSVVDEGV